MSRTRFHLSSYQYSFPMFQRLLALLTCVLFVGTSIPAMAAPLVNYGSKDSQGVAGSSSSSNAKAPRLVFVSPTFGASETGSSVTVSVKIRQDQEVSSLTVKLNGHDVSGQMGSSSCERRTCTLTGTVTTQDGLKNGDNLLWASISSSTGASGDVQWISFDYSDELSSGTGNTIEQYDPASVGISTVTPGGGNPWIQITTGSTMGVSDPVASFPTLPDANNMVTIPYPDTQFSTDCTTILQAIVLDRSNPSVEEATGCGNTVPDIETSLKSALGRSLGYTDLVVLGTTSGNIAPSGPNTLNTTDFGGTDYSKTASTLYPQQYMLIGVKGAAAGTAHESYDVAKGTDTQNQSPASLQGTLMGDTNGNYNYVPSGDQLFSVTSGAAPESTSITIGNQTFHAPANSSGAGEFWLLVLDRQTLQPVNYAYNQPSGEAWVSCQGTQTCGGIYPVSTTSSVLNDLATVLNNVSPRNLVFLMAAGCPIQSASQLPPVLGQAIQNLGGVAYALENLTTGSKTCAYSLISVNDGNHTNSLTGNAALSANQYSAQQQLGALQGYLARDKSGLYDVAGKAQSAIGSNGSPTTAVDFTFEQAASTQRVDWPLTNTSSLLAAYHDISYQLSSAAGETGSHIYDMRYFYTNPSKASEFYAQVATLSPSEKNPPQISSWDKATNAADFATAKAQLYQELLDEGSAAGYLIGGVSGDGGILGQLNGTNASILSDMFAMASDISADDAKTSSQKVDGSLSNALNLAAGISSIGAAIPGVGVVFGIMSGVLWTGSAAASLDDGGSSIPGPENYFDTTLSGLAKNASTAVALRIDGFNGAVDNIFTDWTKLQTVGGYTRNSDSAWNIPDQTALNGVGAALTAGTTRSLWLDVIPNLYGIRLFFDKPSPDPTTYTYEYQPAGYPGTLCDSVYENIPAASMRAYTNFADISHYNVVILAEGTTLVNNYKSKVRDTAVSSDLAKFLTTTQSYPGDATQPGLNLGPDILFNNGPLLAIPGAQYSTVACIPSPTGAEEASFTITPAPGAETIRRGDLGAFVLRLKSVNGFKGNVKLSCSGGPPNSQCDDLPRTVKVNGTAYALSGIRFPRKTAPGTYTINFTGVSGTATNSATANFTVK